MPLSGRGRGGGGSSMAKSRKSATIFWNTSPRRFKSMSILYVPQNHVTIKKGLNLLKIHYFQIVFSRFTHGASFV